MTPHTCFVENGTPAPPEGVARGGKKPGMPDGCPRGAGLRHKGHRRRYTLIEISTVPGLRLLAKLAPLFKPHLVLCRQPEVLAPKFLEHRLRATAYAGKTVQMVDEVSITANSDLDGEVATLDLPRGISMCRHTEPEQKERKAEAKQERPKPQTDRTARHARTS
jgi:hypothetical protein